MENQIKNKIETATGLKLSIKKGGLNTSMRGYLTFTTKKQNGVYTGWSYDFAKEMLAQYDAPEPHPTFCNDHQFSVYIGNEIYN